MLQLKNFDEICVYIKNHSVEEMLEPILRYELILYGCKYESKISYKDLKSELNKLTEGKYSIVLGDRIEAQVIDLKENLDEYIFIYKELFKDDISRKTLFNLLLYRLTYAGEYIAKAYCSGITQYFDKSVAVYRKNCVYADCGGLDGATAVEFAINCPSYKRIYLYEPIKKYYEDCKANISSLGLENVVVKEAAVCDDVGKVMFDESIVGSSRKDDKGMIEVQAVSLDKDVSESLGFIKMDIEGSEKEAINGAEEHIKNNNPMLAICVYHLPSDLWQIPKMIYDLCKNYTFYLRHHTLTPNETVLYAVPNIQKMIQKYDTMPERIRIACLKFLRKIKRKEEENIVQYAAFLLKQSENYQIDYYNALNSIHDLHKWNEELERAKTYLEDQVKNKDSVIIELKNWTKELEKAKTYLEDQVKNKDNAITELKNWTKELEVGKNYLETQWNSAKNENEKIAIHCSEIENRCDELNNINSKLKYKLNVLLNDIGVQKIIKKKRYDV